MQTARISLSSTPQDRVNLVVYDRKDMVGEYAVTSLTPPEAVVLLQYRDELAGRPVLELGCGAGRFATYLRPLTSQYTGIDLSPHMIAHCRTTLGGMDFREGDMRSLPDLAPGSYESVFGLFNLLDAVDHQDRLRTLAEARRVLTADGLLVFSTHNRRFAHVSDGPRLRRSRNAITQLRFIKEYAEGMSNRLRIGRLQRFEAEYSLLNDSGHNYSLLHYYIDRETQARQLEAAGFRLLDCYNEKGEKLGPGDSDVENSSLLYVARRVP